jgi:hypothetical protein
MKQENNVPSFIEEIIDNIRDNKSDNFKNGIILTLELLIDHFKDIDKNKESQQLEYFLDCINFYSKRI